MAAKQFKPWLKRFILAKKRKKAGFTLIELLISMLMAGVIITALLSFVIDLVENDRREYARSETQREMQTALDFIVADLREAVYVYDNISEQRPATRPLLDFLPDQFRSQPYRPIFAFWKVDRIPDNKLPSSCPSDDQECNNLLVSRRAYTLVVYLQQKNPENDPKWKGKSRILRYELPKYKYNSLPTLTKTDGYADPEGSDTQGRQTNFQNWPEGVSRSNPTLPLGGPPVLVDFVDDPENTTDERGNQLTIPGCTSTDSTSPLFTPQGAPQPYRRLPAENLSNDKNSKSFFVCVKSLNVATGTSQQESANQDVIIYLRGNPLGRVGRQKEPLITLQTQAIARGVVDKKPQ